MPRDLDAARCLILIGLVVTKAHQLDLAVAEAAC